MFVVVALFTAVAEPARVGVFPAMTAVAILGDLVLEIARAMAVLAVDARVHAKERKSRLLQVVEFGGLPAGGRMTVTALRPALAAVNVIRRVA